MNVEGKKHRARLLLLVGLVNSLTVTILCIVTSLIGLFEIPELDFYDLLTKTKSTKKINPHIVLVGVTESDIKYLNGWPISDRNLAIILNKIKAQSPHSIALDIYRDFPVFEGYSELQKVFETTPNLIGVENVLLSTDPNEVIAQSVAPPEFLAQNNQVAIANLIFDQDFVVRRAFLAVVPPNSRDQKSKLSLSARLALDYLADKDIKPKAISNQQFSYQLGKSIFYRLKKNSGGYTKAQIRGNQILINYQGEPCNIAEKCMFKQVSIQDLLENNIPSDLFKDKIVIFGAFSSSLNDFFYTPYDSPMYGIEIHGHITSQIIEAALEGNALIKTLPELVEWLWIFLWVSTGSLFGILLGQKRWEFAGIFPISAFLILINHHLFSNNIWLPIVAPFAGIYLSLITAAIYLFWQQLKSYTQDLEVQVMERTVELEKKNQVLAIQNIQLDKAREIADAANRAKSQFLANMSHELRTPLNAILGFSQLMNRDPNLNLTQDTYLSIINRSGEHLLGLINDVLDMAKIEAGQMSLNVNSFDLRATLGVIGETFILKAAEKGLDLEFVIQDSVPQYIMGDEKKIRQILLNLLSNSLKFTEFGFVRLLVQVAEKEEEQYVLSFVVQDTGEGIKETEIQTIFTSFTQTESGVRSNQGTGLGLPISRKFVRMMGGDIFVTSRVGVGTTVRFTIKVQSVLKELIQLPQKQQRVIALAPNQAVYKILIVDDHWVNRKLLEQLLTHIGFTVKEAENGQEAIALWESWQPHLIWTDVRMPILNGYDMTREIRRREMRKCAENGSIEKTIILAITASILKEEEIRIAASGCDGFVRKPFQEDEVLNLMKSFLDIQYLYEDLQRDLPISKGYGSSTIDKSNLHAQISLTSQQWRENLKNNAIVGDDQNIFLLLEELPTAAKDLKATLKGWTEEFRFDLIQDLLL
ncbi:CHASE2 domain-containing protein [[Limnothrix rosea] IAM M-220]|uniref:CHASE2 domain-containing protein n=1 Tax=[Limnothrix rosea] IAM M-220 TaxID=454133 RepID=UPI00095A50C4|nr:CHASE2 domain-containing protein [[Limnothrix rosea] IAM M-220]OKH18345.1 hypothetical protein NIES208_06390 [[Limnothrix rosea] IAM M-220]